MVQWVVTTNTTQQKCNYIHDGMLMNACAESDPMSTNDAQSI